MRPTHHSPHLSPHVRIECQPVGCVAPCPRNAFGRGHPGAAAVFAPMQLNIGIGDKMPMGVKRIEEVAVAGGNVEPSGGPVSAWNPFGICLCPVLSPVV